MWWRRVVAGAAFLAVAGVVATSVAVALGSHGPSATTTVVAAALDTGGSLALLVRRRWPVPVLGTEVVVAVCTTVLTTTFARHASILLVVLALYIVATDRAPKVSIGAAATAEILIGAATCLRGDPLLQDLGDLVPVVAFLTAAVAVGISVRSQRRLVQSLRDRAEQAELEQLWGAARAVAAERVRIARELHDIVAHHVSLLVVQAGAVRETLPVGHVTGPVLDSMVEGGRRAMAELRGMLGALRPVEQPTVPELATNPPAHGGPVPDLEAAVERAPRSPQPTLDQVPDLVTGARSAGLPVSLHVDGVPNPVAPVVSLSAYRIVQEAVTNVVKHAPGAFTTVTLRYGAATLEVEVCNGTSPARTHPARSTDAVRAPEGHGMTGMAERATLAGGTVTAAPKEDGWRVHAVFPLGPYKMAHEAAPDPSAEPAR